MENGKFKKVAKDQIYFFIVLVFSRDMKSRKAKEFALGCPYLVQKGVYYCWPDRDYQAYPPIFNSHRKELGDYLLQQTRSYMGKKLSMDVKYYPYLNSGIVCETIHIGDGGTWLEFGAHSPGNGMVASHNVDSYRDRVMAFNLASDMLEFLDPDMRAPRIVPESESHRLIYPFVPRQDIPQHIFKEDWIYRVLGKGNFHIDRIKEAEKIIELKEGRVEIAEDNCVGIGFERFQVVPASFLMAKIVDRFSLT